MPYACPPYPLSARAVGVPPDDHSTAWEPWSPGSLAEPTTSPALLMAVAPLWVPPSVRRSVIVYPGRSAPAIGFAHRASPSPKKAGPIGAGNFGRHMAPSL